MKGSWHQRALMESTYSLISALLQYREPEVP